MINFLEELSIVKNSTSISLIYCNILSLHHTTEIVLLLPLCQISRSHLFPFSAAVNTIAPSILEITPFLGFHNMTPSSSPFISLSCYFSDTFVDYSSSLQILNIGVDQSYVPNPLRPHLIKQFKLYL